MQITKISFSKTVESNVMGAGVWIKIGLDANVSEDENIAGAIEEAKEYVEAAIQKSLPVQPVGDIFFNVSKNREERI